MCTYVEQPNYDNDEYRKFLLSLSLMVTEQLALTEGLDSRYVHAETSKGLD
jgi:hypothetical protein